MQMTVTHWFYLYIPWFAPFALVALIPEWPALRRVAVAPATQPDPDPDPEPLTDAFPAGTTA